MYNVISTIPRNQIQLPFNSYKEDNGLHVIRALRITSIIVNIQFTFKIHCYAYKTTSLPNVAAIYQSTLAVYVTVCTL